MNPVNLSISREHTHFSITTIYDVTKLQLREYSEHLRASGCKWMGGRKIKGKWEFPKAKYWAIPKDKKDNLIHRLAQLGIHPESLTFTPITILCQDEELREKLEIDLANAYKNKTDTLCTIYDRDDLDEKTRNVMIETTNKKFDEEIISLHEEIVRLFDIQQHREDKSQGKLEEVVSEEVQTVIRELNKRFMILDVPQCSIVEECYEQQASPILNRIIKRRFFRYYQRQNFKTYFDTTKVMHEGRMRSHADVWMHSPQRRHYNELVFKLDKPIHEYEEDGRRCLNTWEGWQIEPIAGSCELFKRHMLEVICSGDQSLYEFLFKLLASWIQRPMEWTVCPVIRGKQGSGKGIFTNVLMEIFGSAALECSNHELVFGRFNSAIIGKLLIHLNEALFGGDRKIIGRLKMFVTESKTIIEMKGREPFSMDNRAKLIITSNEVFAIPVDAQDRRFLFLDTSEEYVGCSSYFDALLNELRSGGIQAFFHEIQNIDLQGFNQRMLPQEQKYGFDNKITSEDSFLQYLHEVLVQETFNLAAPLSEWKKQIRVDELNSWYAEYCKEKNGRVLLDCTIGRRLKQVLHKTSFSKIRMTTGARKLIYQLPSVEEARRAFCKFFNTSYQSVFPS